MRSLLAGVAVVDDLGQARALVARHPGIAVVTRAGTSSRRRARGAGRRRRRACCTCSRRSTRRAPRTPTRRPAPSAPGSPSWAREAAQEARARYEDTLDRLNESDAQLAAVAEQLGHLGATARSAAAEAERVRASLEQASQGLDDARETLAGLVERLEVAEAAPEQSEDAVAEASAERDRLLARASAARTAETEARLALRTSEERSRAVAGRAQSLARAAAAERDARERAARREAARVRQAGRASAVRDGATLALAAIDRSLARAGAERDAAEAARAERDTAVTAARREVDDLASRLRELTDVAHRDEVARAQQQLRIEQLQARSVDELGLDPAVLVEELGPHREVPVPSDDDEPRTVPYDRAQQEKRLRAAERDLGRLGKVNPLALEEFAALEERHKFLADQLADLKKSRADLLEIVKEIDERVERVFSDAYRDTAEQFERVFARMFPGGEGRLVLTDPDDMLTTGIEVEARPAGRRSSACRCCRVASARSRPSRSSSRSSRPGPRRSTSWTRSRPPWTT